MTRYAAYEARRPGSPGADEPRPFLVRPAVLADRDEVAVLYAGCEGGTLEEHREGFEKAIMAARPDLLILVAEIDGRIVGWTVARRFQHPPEPPADVAPEGWYLLGVIVAPEHRRRGIGMELTRRRLAWIAARAGEAFCFIDTDNRASIDLHERLGFVEVTRDFTYPGVTFDETGGILFRLDLTGTQTIQAPADPST